MTDLTAYTKADYENMRELHRFRLRRVKWGLGVFIVLFCVLAFRRSVSVAWPNIGALLPYVAATGMLATMMVGFVHYGYTKRSHLRSAGTLPEGWSYTFSENNITMRADDKEPSEIPYDSLFRVAETQNLFLLYINRMASLPVDKRGIQSGTAEELRTLLKAKLPAEKCKL